MPPRIPKPPAEPSPPSESQFSSEPEKEEEFKKIPPFIKKKERPRTWRERLKDLLAGPEPGAEVEPGKTEYKLPWQRDSFAHSKRRRPKRGPLEQVLFGPRPEEKEKEEVPSERKKRPKRGALEQVLFGPGPREKAEVVPGKEKPAFLMEKDFIDVTKLAQEAGKHKYYNLFPGAPTERKERVKEWFENRQYVSPQHKEQVRKKIEQKIATTSWAEGKIKYLREKKLFEEFFPKKKP